jgi:hypothetical protein
MITFHPINVTFGRTSEGLDTLTRDVRVLDDGQPLTAVEARAAVPARYTEDEDFGGMYLMDVAGGESVAESGSLSLIYHGSLDSTLPPDMDEPGSALQQAQYTSFSGGTTISLTYVSPTSTRRTITTALPVSSIGATAPAAVQGVWFTAKTTEGATLPTTPAAAVGFFSAKLVTLPSSRTLVPGQVWENTEAKLYLLFSNEA